MKNVWNNQLKDLDLHHQRQRKKFTISEQSKLIMTHLKSFEILDTDTFRPENYQRTRNNLLTEKRKSLCVL